MDLYARDDRAYIEMLVDLLNIGLPEEKQLKARQKQIYAEMIVCYNEGKGFNSKAFREELAEKLTTLIPRKNPYTVKDVQRYVKEFADLEWFQRQGQVYSVARVFDFRTTEDFPAVAPKNRTIMLTITNLREHGGSEEEE